MKPPSKAIRQRPPPALHHINHGIKKSKPKNMEVKKNLKVWFNVNPEIISEKNGFHKSLNELLNMKQQRKVLGSKSLSNLELNKLSRKDFLKSCSSQSALLCPANTESHINRRCDNLVFSYDDSYLEDDICLKRRNIPRKSILKNKSHHTSFSSGSYQNYKYLWDRKCDHFNSFESENSFSSLGLNSDSITRLYKCSEPFNPITYSSEKEMFDDLTSSAKRLHISQISLSESLNSSQYMNLLYGSQNHSNEMCKLMFGHASNEICEDFNSSVPFWSDKNNSSNSDEENLSAKQDQNSSNSSTGKGERNNNASTLVGPQIKFHLESAPGILSSSAVPPLALDVFEKNSNCCCPLGKAGGNILTTTERIQDDRGVKIVNKDSQQLDVKEYHDGVETACHRYTLLKCPIVNCDVPFSDPTLLAKHMSEMEHSACNPAASLINGILPTSVSFLCPLCGHISLDEEDCLNHMLTENHDILLPAVPFFVYTCPQCLSFFPTITSALQHMDSCNHHVTAFTFQDDKKKIVKPYPIPMPCKVMMEFVSRCQQAEYGLYCKNCLEHLHTPQQVQFHLYNKHTVLSQCDKSAVDVFSTLLTDNACAECLQFIYRKMPKNNNRKKWFCIHIHTDCPLQGQVSNLRARSLKEFILRCGKTDINFITVKKLKVEDGCTTSNLDTLAEMSYLSYDVPSSQSCLEKPRIGQVQVESTKKPIENNNAAVANNSNPHEEGTSKQFSEQNDYFPSKSQYKDNSSNEHSVTCDKTNVPDSSSAHRDRRLKKLKRKCDFPPESEPKRKMALASTTGSETTEKSALCREDTQASTLEHHGKEQLNNSDLSSSECFPIDSNHSQMSQLKGESNTEPETNKVNELNNTEPETNKVDELNNCGLNFFYSRQGSLLKTTTQGNSEIKYEDMASLEYIPLKQLSGSHRKKHLPVNQNFKRYWDCGSNKSPYKSSNSSFCKLRSNGQSVKDNKHVASMVAASHHNGYQRFTPYQNQPQMYRYNGPVYDDRYNGPVYDDRYNGPVYDAYAPNFYQGIPPSPVNNFTGLQRVIFADLENYALFKYFRGPFPSWTYVWGFVGARTKSPRQMENYFSRFPLYRGLKQMGCICLTTDIGSTKDAADFALCLAVAKLDDRLPPFISFFIVSKDTGFREVENQMKYSHRRVQVIAPRMYSFMGDFL